MTKFLQIHPPITKAIKFLHTLFSHISTLNRVIFRCSSQLNCLFFNDVANVLNSKVSHLNIHTLSFSERFLLRGNLAFLARCCHSKCYSRICSRLDSSDFRDAAHFSTTWVWLTTTACSGSAILIDLIDW
jgi:hypothetical protein